jgi:hypothetical protein
MAVTSTSPVIEPLQQAALPGMSSDATYKLPPWLSGEDDWLLGLIDVPEFA